jgi:putative two-component system response regulator
VLEGRWALVVEDDARSLMAIGMILEELGIHYKRNTTGYDVAQKAQTMYPKPEFILLDMDLPQGDPFHIIEALKAAPDTADIPVIAIADASSDSTIDQTRDAGFSGFVAKPLPRRQFGQILQRILGDE